MSGTSDSLVDGIFSEPLEREDQERDEYLRRRCQGDAKLLQRIVALLEASQASDEAISRRIDSARDELWRSILVVEEAASEDLSGRRSMPGVRENALPAVTLEEPHKSRGDVP